VIKTTNKQEGVSADLKSTKVDAKVDTKITHKVKLPGEAYSPRIRARFWIVNEPDDASEACSESYIGIGRIELLENIEKLGSMSQAAKSMGMSYKKAWKLIQELNDMHIEPLVTKEHGGKSGGGTQLTARGLQVIDEFRALEKEFIKFLEGQSKKIL